jgi:hypothetical protein
LLDPFYLGIAFQVKDGAIANAHIVIPTTDRLYYASQGNYYSGEEYVFNNPDILEAYKKMYAEIQKC